MRFIDIHEKELECGVTRWIFVYDAGRSGVL
jgi:hypothetical protein